MRAYVFRTNDKPPGPAITDENALRPELTKRLRPFAGDLTVHPWGDKEGPPRKRGDAVTRALKKAQNGPVGYAVWVKNEHDKGVLLHVIDVVVPASLTNGNEKVDRWFAELKARYSPGLLNLGCTVNKNIGSTGSISQHHDWTPETGSNWKLDGFTTADVSDDGNAGDFAHADGRQRMTDMWEWSLANRDHFEFQNLIHWPLGSPYTLIWNEAGGVHRYDVPSGGSTHDNHLHGDFVHSRPWGGSVPRY